MTPVIGGQKYMSQVAIPEVSEDNRFAITPTGPENRNGLAQAVKAGLSESPKSLP